MVACGPPGLNGDTNILYHNNGDGTFTDVSESAGITRVERHLRPRRAASRLRQRRLARHLRRQRLHASALYKNQKNGKFVDVGLEAGCVLSADGKPQAGMGVSAADYDLDGNLDILKTNFAGDTPSLYRNLGEANFEDATFRPDWARTRSTWAGVAASSISTTTAGPTS